jgi:hypothetical protein
MTMSFFPPFFSQKLKSRRGLSGLLGWQYVVVAVTAVVFMHFFFLLKKIGIPKPQQTLHLMKKPLTSNVGEIKC